MCRTVRFAPNLTVSRKLYCAPGPRRRHDFEQVRNDAHPGLRRSLHTIGFTIVEERPRSLSWYTKRMHMSTSWVARNPSQAEGCYEAAEAARRRNERRC